MRPFFGSLHAYRMLLDVIGSGMTALILGVILLIGKRKLLPVILGHGAINTISMTAYRLSDGAIA